MSNFFSSLFGGSNSTVNSAIPQFGSISQFGVNQGEGDINAASGFWNSILSGDPAKIGQVLGPQIQNIQGQGQQQKQKNAQFGNRSGGLNASNQMIGDTTRSNVNNMVSNLTGNAASSLAGLGTNLLGQGTSALSAQVDTSQQQLQNWQNSILGTGIASGIGGLEAAGLGKV